MSLEFDEDNFRCKVDKALKDIQRILEIHRNPRLAEDVDHVYGDKYRLVDQITNTALIGQLNALAHFGLTSEVLKSIDTSKPSTLRFQAAESCIFLEEQTVEVPMEKTVETNEHTQTSFGSLLSGTTTKSTIKQVIHQVKEYHWKVQVQWEISLHAGTSSSVDDIKILQTRSSSKVVIIQSKKGAPLPDHRECKPMDLSLTWLMEQIDTNTMSLKFYVDTQDPETKTPRRNRQVDDALRFMCNLETWSSGIRDYLLFRVQRDIIDKHNPAGPRPSLNDQRGRLISLSDDAIFVPVQVLLEELSKSAPPSETRSKSFMAFPSASTISDNGDSSGPSPVLSTQDMHNFLNEQIRSIEEQMEILQKTYPARERNEVVSVAEASIVLVSLHSKRLAEHFQDAVTYVERMLCDQLEAAIGKHVTSSDIDQFVRYHNARLLNPAPRPFCHAIRQVGRYPYGLISIEGSSHNGAAEKQPIETLSREVESFIPMRLPLNAATTVELTGKKYLHGWMHHRFGGEQNHFELIARARQFSSFLLVVGTMAGPDELHPKDAIIVENKDELSIPLILTEIPTSKEFKDAIRSLSPEQQRFSQAFRSMQLGSSVLGICVIQIKPQLEVLLGLGRDALTKELKLTQDLMELFVEYQIPADLLSCDRIEAGVVSSPKEQVDNVKNHVKAVLDVIEEAKKKQSEEQTLREAMLLASDFSVASRVEPFRLIDHLLPKKPSQSLENRAKDLDKTLTWIRNRGVDEWQSLPISDKRTPNENLADLGDILRWVRNPKDNDTPQTLPFKIISLFLPKKPGQSPADRAKDIDTVFTWVRNRGVDQPESEPPLRVAKLKGIPIDHRTPEEKELDVGDILKWMRDPRKNNTPETEPFKRTDQLLPQKPGQSIEDRANDIDNTLTWLRNRGIDKLDELERITVDKRTPEERFADIDDILNWVRNPKENDTPQAEPFKRIDQLLPKKPGQSPHDRTMDIDHALTWVRNRGVDQPEFESTPNFNKLNSIPIDHRTPEETARDVDDILTWARSTMTTVPPPPAVSTSQTNQPSSSTSILPQQDIPPLDSTKCATEATEKRYDEDIDFTAVPQILNSAIEKHSGGAALRSTTISLSPTWQRQRLENLLSSAKVAILHAESDIKTERNKAYDLLDAISRSGALPIRSSELHVIVCVTHCFEKDVIDTVIRDNSNPIEKLELSTLLVAAATHGVPTDRLIRCSSDLLRLRCSHPLLFSADQKGST